jgi:hypothetical protein
VAASHIKRAIGARNRPVFEIAFFIVISLIAALLITGVPKCVAAGHTVADMYFRHHPAEVFGVV